MGPDRTARSGRVAGALAATVAVAVLIATCGGGDDETGADGSGVDGTATDEVVVLFARELAVGLGISLDDATCLSEILVEDLDDLIAYEGGEFIEPPDTPEINDRVNAALTAAADECGVDIGVD